MICLQNSIRHNLSLYSIFEREKSKKHGSYWTIREDCPEKSKVVPSKEKKGGIKTQQLWNEISLNLQQSLNLGGGGVLLESTTQIFFTARLICFQQKSLIFTFEMHFLKVSETLGYLSFVHYRCFCLPFWVSSSVPPSPNLQDSQTAHSSPVPIQLRQSQEKYAYFILP